jgi:autotransporter-associated beta strand protein
MTDTTWLLKPGSNDYTNGGNWSVNTPGQDDTGFFGTSNTTDLSIGTFTQAGGWVFNPWAAQYIFTITSSGGLQFFGSGISVNGGGATIYDGGAMDFFDNSSAGKALIVNDGSGLGSGLTFHDGSNAGNATIININQLSFTDDSSAGMANIINQSTMTFDLDSSAGSAKIQTFAGGSVTFRGNSNGGKAQLITHAGGIVDFSQSSGPGGNHHLSVGSIAGGGTYELGADQLTVGGNARSTTVTGPIDDGGAGGGIGGALVKVGHGTLKLSHAHNTYSGGTTLKAGGLDVAALGAAGIGAIKFAGLATLKIENAALSHHVFSNPIDKFGNNDVLDLSGLSFDPAATAAYHAASHHLTVHSGSVTDTLTLLGPLGTHFEAISDGHGGTDLLLHA